MANPTIPSVPLILNTAKIVLSIAIKDRAKKNTLYTGLINEFLPEKIYLIWKSVQHRYDKNPIDTTLRDTANLLWSLLGRYHLILGQGGGTVVSGNGGTVCPFGVGAIFITGAQLDGSNIYLNSGLAQELLVFYNGGQRYLILNEEWEYVRDTDGRVIGVKILFGNFTSEDVFVISPNPKCGEDTSASSGAIHAPIQFTVGSGNLYVPNNSDTAYDNPTLVGNRNFTIYRQAIADYLFEGIDFYYKVEGGFTLISTTFINGERYTLTFF